MTLPADALDALKAFKENLPKPVVTKKLKRLKGVQPNEKPPFFSQVKPTDVKEPKQDNVRRNGKGCWLVMNTTGAAYRGLKSREDPVVRDAPITKAPYNLSHTTGNTAQICNDASIFKRTR